MDTDIRTVIVTHPDGSKSLRVTSKEYRDWMEERCGAKYPQRPRFFSCPHILVSVPTSSLSDRVKAFIENF